MYLFTCVGWGPDKTAWTVWPLGVKIIRVGKNSCDSLSATGLS